jgi:cytochrome c biogenesis protein CcmG, thiol:disulfide interchange protein DsbE
MFMIKWFLCLAGLALSLPLNAATVKFDSLAVGAVTYSNVTVLGANATDLYFTHQNGIANIKLKYLSPALQKQFDYDPKAAAEAEKNRQDEEARYHSSLAATITAQAQKNLPQEPQLGLNWVDPVADTSPVGRPAPAISVEKWLNDEPTRKDKYVLISFWSADSSACRKFIPQLNELQKKFADRLVVIGIASDPASTISNLKDPKIEFTLAVDTKSKLRKALGITSVPSVVLVDAKGVVRYVGHPAAVSEAALKSVFLKPAE